ncbi:uncharacterized protein JCM6883_005526 [Sporobolomyces salmoneus]|uniref:uncharacterized protein n=1 Tax=Sporobolomyces salmoneus TaxID=183962 RepID=UPI003171850D
MSSTFTTVVTSTGKSSSSTSIPSLSQTSGPSSPASSVTRTAEGSVPSQTSDDQNGSATVSAGSVVSRIALFFVVCTLASFA